MPRDERWERLQSLFAELAGLGREERAARLAAIEDAALRDRVAALLDSDAAEESFIQRSPTLRGATPAADSLVGRRIGRFDVRGVIASGGMGTVYRAEQEHPRRTVALKVLRPGALGPGALRRFELEVEVLGRLEHPGIGRIYDAGTFRTDAGEQPYFAMEFVDGRPMTEHARGLGVAERLELLARVCDAVQHAHRMGVIHRDLKPANILVDGNGNPKVLDFGVARATGSDVQATMQTDVGQLVGTLAYMSPEQLSGDPREVDTRSDVYALGIVAYELLIGRLPHDVGGRSVVESIAILREARPPTLGTIDRSLRGDVETIVRKAIEPERERRYQSAADLAADIRRHLANEPIAARPPSTLYLVGRFARRHTAVVVAGIVVFIVLVAGVSITTPALVRAVGAERAAKREASTTRAINEALARMLSSVNPRETGREARVVYILEQGVREADSMEPTRPGVAARLRWMIGTAYYDLEMYDEAEPQLARAYATQRVATGEEHPETLDSLHDWALALEGLRRYEEAEGHLERALAGRERALEPDAPPTLETRNALARMRFNRGDAAGAAPKFRDVLARRERILGPEHRETLLTKVSLAAALRQLGERAEAERLYAESLEVLERVLGPDHVDTLTVAGILGLLARDRGDLVEAERLLRRSLEGLRATMVQDSHWTLMATMHLGNVLSRMERHDEAIELGRDALAGFARIQGVESPSALRAADALGRALAAAGRVEESVGAFAEAIGAAEAGPPHPFEASLRSRLSDVLAEAGRFDEAEVVLLAGFGRVSRMEPPNAGLVGEVRSKLAALYERWGKPEEAARWRNPQ